MELKIATHNGIFHADEVTAVALLKLFGDKDVKVTRVGHDTKDFSLFDMVIDIGRKFDGKKYFDHHQYKGGKSSAGLVWEYLEQEEQYPNISKLVKMVDENDVGTAKSRAFEYPSLIKHFNASEDIYGKEQDANFQKAVDFAYTVLHSMKRSQEDMEDARHIVSNSYFFDGNRHIMELDCYTRFWSSYINGENTPEIKAVVWEDENEGKWKIKIPPKRPGSFELVVKPLVQDDTLWSLSTKAVFLELPKREKRWRRILKNKNSFKESKQCPCISIMITTVKTAVLPISPTTLTLPVQNAEPMKGWWQTI